jgi:hypothetical protein
MTLTVFVTPQGSASCCKSSGAHLLSSDYRKFSNAAELAASLTIAEMDAIRGASLGECVEPSGDVAEAADRLWLAAVANAPIAAKREARLGILKNRGEFCERGTIDKFSTHLLMLVPDSAEEVDAFDTVRLSPQVRAIVQILLDDGRKAWTVGQLRRLLERERRFLNTKRRVALVIATYVPWLVTVGLLEKISVDRYINDPRFFLSFWIMRQEWAVPIHHRRLIRR